MEKMEKKAFTEEIELPPEVKAGMERGILSLSGPKGETSKPLKNKKVDIKAEGTKISLKTKRAGKKEKKILKSFSAHIKNMIKGATEGHVYKMKICSGHFPISVAVEGSEVVIKNFIGEKYPRKIKILEGVKIKVSGSDITLEGADKEKVSQMCAKIEEKTKRRGFDKRIFQDGCYIVSKSGKEIK